MLNRSPIPIPSADVTPTRLQSFPRLGHVMYFMRRSSPRPRQRPVPSRIYIVPSSPGIGHRVCSDAIRGRFDARRTGGVAKQVERRAPGRLAPLDAESKGFTLAPVTPSDGAAGIGRGGFRLASSGTLGLADAGRAGPRIRSRRHAAADTASNKHWYREAGASRSNPRGRNDTGAQHLNSVAPHETCALILGGWMGPAAVKTRDCQDPGLSSPEAVKTRGRVLTDY